jgi:hypothetical protein
VSLVRLVVIAIVVMIAGSGLALLLDHGERGRTSTTTVTVGVTDTVTATKTVTQAATATSSAEPEVPDSSEAGFKILWKGPLRLNQNGHDLDGANGPVPSDGLFPDVRVTNTGYIAFDDPSVSVAKHTGSDMPKPSECAADKTRSLSSQEASSILPKTGLQLCLNLEAGDGSPRIGYMRVRPGFTNIAVEVEGVLWDKP